MSVIIRFLFPLFLLFNLSGESTGAEGLLSKPIFNRFIGIEESRIVRKFGEAERSLLFHAKDGMDELRRPVVMPFLTGSGNELLKESIYQLKSAVVFIWYVKKKGVWVVVGDAYVPDGIQF